MLVTYINANQFSIAGTVDHPSGDWTDEIRIGTMLFCAQGADGTLLTDVASAIYDAGDDLTTVVVSAGGLTANLTAIGYGPLFVDPINFLSNLSRHSHSAFWDGGYEPFSLWDDAGVVENLKGLGSVSDTVKNWMFGVNAAGDGVEKKEFEGTENQVVIEHTVNKVKFRGPQNLGLTNSPQFTGLKLSGLLSKALVTDATGVLVAPTDNSTGAAVLVKTGTVYSLENFKLQSLVDVEWGTPSHGDVHTYDAVSGKAKWSPASASSGGVDVGTVVGLIQVFSGGSDDEEAGAAAAHASNHIDGGSDPIDADKLLVDVTAENYTPALVTDITTELDQLSSHLKGIDNALPAPTPWNYTPRGFYKKSATQVTIPADTYYALGYRHRGRYSRASNVSWDINSPLDVTVADSMIDSGIVNSSWYNLFLLSASTCKVLPCVHVHSTELNAGNTRIYFGQHDDATIYETGFFSSANPFNSYRVVKLRFDSTDGMVYGIIDSVSGATYDYLVVGGDQTANIVAGDWLMLVPPESTDALYLGTLRINSAGEILQLNRIGWEYSYAIGDYVQAVLGTSPDNTEVSPLVSPQAIKAIFDVYSSSGTSNVTGVGAKFYSGTSGTDLVTEPFFYTGASDAKEMQYQIMWNFSAPAQIRNNFWAGAGAADDGTLAVVSFQE